jgi:ABC-type multidrug transport system ATPase subunit
MRDEPHGIRIDVTDVSTYTAGSRRRPSKKLLSEISLSVLPGELVAIVGGSGAGKSTLLDAISGVRPSTSGRVAYNGRDYYADLGEFRQSLGYVPQDDIIHTQLPVRRTLTYAAKLRLPADTTSDELDRAVDEVLRQLGLVGQAGIRVSSLSGGQRKRVSIGVELLTNPRVFFLDEPTSGLDPATDTQMMRLMRRLADEGSTVAITTHTTQNIDLCDKVVILVPGGYLAFVGSPRRALQYFEVENFVEIYGRLAEESTPEQWGDRFRASEDFTVLLADQQRSVEPPGGSSPSQGRRNGIGEAVRQFRILQQRNRELLTSNRRNLGPFISQPLVIGLLTLLVFSSGLFKTTVDNPQTPLAMLFFLVMGSLFFGVISGLQEVVKEAPIFRRERMANLGVAPYVLSKAGTLIPLLMLQVVIMVVLLWLTGRLPSSGFDVYVPLVITLWLTAFAGLAISLLMSSASNTVEQPARMQPAVVIPNLLFAGLFLPVPSMGIVGRVLSKLMVSAWSLNTLGSITDLNRLFRESKSPLGRGLLQAYGNTFDANVGLNWAILLVFIVVPLLLSCLILRRRTTPRVN